MIEQFFTMMKYCTELLLSGRNSFEFAQTLLENQVENIRQIGGSDRTKTHHVLVEQLRMYSKDLRHLKSANPISKAQQVLNSLRTTQEQERKEVKEQIAEEAYYLDDSKVSY